MITFRTSDGVEYLKDQHGIHQVNPKPFTYDANYCATYDTKQYREGNELLQALRLGFVIGAHGGVPESLADIGYGNGAFLYRCKDVIPKLYGKDVSGVVLKFIETVWNYPKCDVVTFWDCIEHIQDWNFLYDMPCETICISLPFCHFDSVEWFDTWKHRKPNEHVHHFNDKTLTEKMARYGWHPVASSKHEDIVRIGVDDKQNILTMAFKRGATLNIDENIKMLVAKAKKRSSINVEAAKMLGIDTKTYVTYLKRFNL